MGFNTDPNDLRRSMQRQDIAKRRLERPVAEGVRKILLDMGDALERSVAATGQGINAEAFAPAMNEVVFKGYADSGATFGVLISDHISSHDNDDTLVMALAAAGLAAGTSAGDEFRAFKKLNKENFATFTLATVPDRVSDMTQTSNKELTRAVNKALEASAAAEVDTGDSFTPKQLGASAKDTFLTSSLFRGDLIGETEIQNAAENAKAIETETFMGTVAVAAAATITLTSQGMWTTMGDDVVRPTHIQADFQVQDTGNAFNVGGFQLMQPGDGTLGAPLSETARCRCQRNDLIE